MSLVNDMLRDLNRRTPVSNQAARVNGAISSRHLHARKPSARLGIALIVLLAVALLGGYLYFEKFGPPRLPVPPAAVRIMPAVAMQAVPADVVPAVQQPVAPAVTAESAPAEPAAASTVVTIFEEAYSDKGFTLRIQASSRVAFDIVARHTYGITLHLDQVDSYDRGPTEIGGMSVQLAGKALNIEFDMNKAVDFSVYEDGATESFDILLAATYRPIDLSSAVGAQPVYEPAAAVVNGDGSMLHAAGIPERAPGAATSAPLPLPGFADKQAAEQLALALNRNQHSPVRVNRELTLEQEDRNNSQTAVTMLQGGRLFEAYEQLLIFIAQNPAAHQSRETLATLLLAQQDFIQAEAIIDDGLALVPNYSSFKKIKARLLMQKADMVQAMQLLRNVPPVVSDDPEYHELLASLYQQTSQHAQAVLSYQELLRVDSKQGRWWTGLAISLEAQGNSKDALASYQAAMQTANLDAGLRQYSQSRVSNLSPQ